MIITSTGGYCCYSHNHCHQDNDANDDDGCDNDDDDDYDVDDYDDDDNDGLHCDYNDEDNNDNDYGCDGARALKKMVVVFGSSIEAVVKITKYFYSIL